jgi:hypothetical protein
MRGSSGRTAAVVIDFQGGPGHAGSERPALRTDLTFLFTSLVSLHARHGDTPVMNGEDARCSFTDYRRPAVSAAAKGVS